MFHSLYTINSIEGYGILLAIAACVYQNVRGVVLQFLCPFFILKLFIRGIGEHKLLFMKKNYLKFLSTLTILFIGLGFSSCSNDDDNPETPKATPIEEVVKASKTGAVTTKGVDFNHTNLKVEKVTLSEMVTVRSTGDKLSTLKVIFNDNVQVVINSLFFANDTAWWHDVLPAHIKYATDITFNLLKEDKTVAISETFTRQSNPKEWDEFMKSDGVQKFCFAFKGDYDYETTTEEGIHVDESNFEPELIQPKPIVPEIPTTPKDTLTMLEAHKWVYVEGNDPQVWNKKPEWGSLKFGVSILKVDKVFYTSSLLNITGSGNYLHYTYRKGYLSMGVRQEEDAVDARFYYIITLNSKELKLALNRTMREYINAVKPEITPETNYVLYKAE